MFLKCDLQNFFFEKLKKLLVDRQWHSAKQTDRLPWSKPVELI